MSTHRTGSAPDTPIARYTKFIVAALGALVIILNELVAHFGQWWDEDTSAWITSIVSVITAIGVFWLRNAPMLDSLATTGTLGDRRNPIEDAAGRHDTGRGRVEPGDRDETMPPPDESPDTRGH